MQSEYEYLDLLREVRQFGEDRSDRTGTGTRSIFGTRMEFDLSDGTIPLLTTKRVHFKSVAEELFWMLRGSTNNRELNEAGVTIWDEWADSETGDLGPVYGRQWRNFNGVDQIHEAIRRLDNDPYSRRIIVSAWNPAELEDMALPPCHALFQFYVTRETDQLSCQLYQRSADLFLGVPFNIASYSLLTCMFADTLGFQRGRFIWTGGDTHIYHNHFDQVDTQLTREPRSFPRLLSVNCRSPLAVKFEDLLLVGYDSHPAIRAPVAV